MTEHVEIDGLTLSYVARRYADEGTSGRAMERLNAKVSTEDGVSAMRVTRPSGEWLIVVVCLTDAMVRRVQERVALGGEAVELTDDEAESIGRRVVDVVGGAINAGADIVNTRANWKGNLLIGPEGVEPARRPQG